MSEFGGRLSGGYVPPRAFVFTSSAQCQDDVLGCRVALSYFPEVFNTSKFTPPRGGPELLT